MGIFNVNLPLLYGEGHRAFARLQKEIIATWDDDSIFCHANISLSKEIEHRDNFMGAPILAERPSDFVTDIQLERESLRHDRHWHSFEWTNKGLKLTIWLSMRRLVLLSQKPRSRTKLKNCFRAILPLRCQFKQETPLEAGEEGILGLLIEVDALPANRLVQSARVFSGIRHRDLYYSLRETAFESRTEDSGWYKWGTYEAADYDIDLGDYDGSEVEAAVYVSP